MLQTLARIAERCDGVRCDMAMLLLPDVMEKTWGARLGTGWIRKSFWGEAIANVRARRSGFLFLAEVYWGLEGRLQAEGFDFTYDKTLYDRLRDGNVAGTRQHLGRPAETQRWHVRFTENHDEPRAAAQFGDRGEAAAVLTYLSPGLKLFHEGQLEGRKVKLPVQLRRRPEEPEDPAARLLHDRLLEVLRDPAFDGGSFALVPPVAADSPGHENVLAFVRRSAAPDAPFWLAAVNLGASRAAARLPLPWRVDPGRTYLFDDRLHDARYERPGAELGERGLVVALDGGRAHVFRVTA
jgi:hypothetical protein